jgi:RNA polymerase sigma-70 factor (ECF subfamily)
MAQFGQTVQQGDLEGLMRLLHDDITAYSDGGGIERAALNPIHGSDRVARFMIGITRKGGAGLEHEITEINSQPGIIGFRDGKARTVLVLDLDADRIRAIYIVTNPQKLERLSKEKQR